MIDLVHLFSKIVDQKGRILIPGINELVDKLTPEEDSLYTPIDFDPEEYRQDIGADKLLHDGKDCKKKTLQHRWRYPSLSIHGTPFVICYYNLFYRPTLEIKVAFTGNLFSSLPNFNVFMCCGRVSLSLLD